MDRLALSLIALLTGFSLGTLGSGGSVLALPAFVFAGGLPVKPAVATSLLVVGITSLVGAVTAQWRCARVAGCPDQQADPRVALQFAAGGLAGSFLGARLGSHLPGSVQALLFAVVAVVVALRMAFKCGKTVAPQVPRRPLPFARYLSLILGSGVGVLTGVVGVGGGFLIVPALTLAAGLPLKRAMSTSLWIIAANSAAGVLGYAGRVPIAWGLAAQFLVMSLAGMWVGQRIARGAPAVGLQRAFAFFLMAVGFWTLASTFMGVR